MNSVREPGITVMENRNEVRLKSQFLPFLCQVALILKLAMCAQANLDFKWRNLTYYSQSFMLNAIGGNMNWTQNTWI